MIGKAFVAHVNKRSSNHDPNHVLDRVLKPLSERDSSPCKHTHYQSITIGGISMGSNSKRYQYKPSYPGEVECLQGIYASKFHTLHFHIHFMYSVLNHAYMYLKQGSTLLI